MQFIDFRDTCTIKRLTGEKDEWDNPQRELIYEGACLYEEGGQSFSRYIITRNPTLFLPQNDVLVHINDSVEVVTEKGRIINSIVKVVRDINIDKMTKLRVTRIELKQAQGE